MLIFVLPSFQKVCTTSVDCPAAFLCDNKVFPLPGFCVNPLTDVRCSLFDPSLPSTHSVGVLVWELREFGECVRANADVHRWLVRSSKSCTYSLAIFPQDSKLVL